MLELLIPAAMTALHCATGYVAAQGVRRLVGGMFINAHQDELQQKQQEFQAAQQAQNIAETARLQRELTYLKFELDRKAQQENFERMIAHGAYTNFVNNQWPLIADPTNYLSMLQQYEIPLSIILGGAVEEKCGGILHEVADFFNTNYSDSKILYYNQGWKESMKNRTGNAQTTAIHQGLNGLPTLVLFPEIVEGKFEFSVSFWGWEQSQKPITTRIATYSLKDVERKCLREMALEYDGFPFGENPQGALKAIQQNLQSAKSEQEGRAHLEKMGWDEQRIETHCQMAYPYVSTGLQEEVRNRLNSRLAPMMEIVGGALSDTYNLGMGMVPKLPSLLKKFSPEIQAEYGPQALDLFRKMATQLDDINRPKTFALLSKAYQEAGETETAKELQKAAIVALETLYPTLKITVADEHREIIALINKNCLLDSKKYQILQLEDFLEKEENKRQREAEEKRRREAEEKRRREEEIKNRKAGTLLTKTADGIEYRFRWCPAGTFMMGSPESEEGRYDDETQHRVTLTRGFWMLETEVTQAMWESVMGNNPSSFKGAQNPVENVSWNDCQKFCRKLSQRLGGSIKLPTEAQWEYACRAGSKGAYAGNLDSMAWYYSNSGSKTHPVGTKQANAWGLYDMHGNVWEWCQDWYGAYPTNSVTDPTGPTSGSLRVYRGGGWSNGAKRCRSAYRSLNSPGDRGDGLGVRVLLEQ